MGLSLGPGHGISVFNPEAEGAKDHEPSRLQSISFRLALEIYFVFRVGYLSLFPVRCEHDGRTVHS